jgi:D-glycero-D-manno-heptose 1,7-bisphosphate phosphatase
MVKQAVFMDLQGTLGGEAVGDIRDFSFFPFSIDAIKLINKNNMLAIIITNQSHISKGYLTIQQYEDYVEKLKSYLKMNNAYIDEIYCCPHDKTDNCTCKKPLPGLIEQAENDFDIDLTSSYIIGDMGCTDMILAKTVGCKSILVRTGVGEGSLNEFRHTWKEVEPDFIANNVLEGVNWILNNKSFEGTKYLDQEYKEI